MFVFRSGLGRLRRVKLRRCAACLLSLTMLQLGMVRADACDAHADVAATGGDMAHHADHDIPPAPTQQPDCDAPSGADCCSAVASCSLVLGTPEALSSDVPMFEQVAFMVAPRAAPFSATAAPETPPPRV
jgi:hypothetical protein